jgi:hypothetical protein
MPYQGFNYYQNHKNLRSNHKCFFVLNITYFAMGNSRFPHCWKLSNAILTRVKEEIGSQRHALQIISRPTI